MFAFSLITAFAVAGPGVGKKVIALHAMNPVRIELPDQTVRELGPDFVARLGTELTLSGEVIVADPLSENVFHTQNLLRDADWVWPGTYVPAADLHLDVTAFNMSTGTRGTRMLYGLDERTQNLPNEFPLVQGKESWFGDTFAGKKDSRTGLDLGEGLSFDLIFAWLGLKWAFFESRLHLRVRVVAPLSDTQRSFDVRVKGTGYFYDVVAGYGAYSGGIRLARTAATLEAFNRAVTATRTGFLEEIRPLRFSAVVDNIVEENGERVFLLGTGHGAEIPAGASFVSSDEDSRVIVLRSVLSGSIARLVSGREPVPGETLKEYRESPMRRLVVNALGERGVAESASLPNVREIETPETVLPKAPFKPGDFPLISRAKAFWKSITGIFKLPYRIWRYRQYDQRFDSNRKVDARDLNAWSAKIRKQIRETKVAAVKVVPTDLPNPMITPLIAVVDTGVDYNHPVLHPTIWRNPNPMEDGQGKIDLTGWDFISGDRKPFDDHFHGTQLAGTIVGIAPYAQIMPLKAFNPWGATTSTALAGAIRYAVDHGAHVVVCAWTSQMESVALASALEYARSRDILVIEQKEVDPALGGQRIPSLEPRGEYSKLSGPTVAAGLTAGWAAYLIASRGETRGRNLKELLSKP